MKLNKQEVNIIKTGLDKYQASLQRLIITNTDEDIQKLYTAKLTNIEFLQLKLNGQQELTL